MGKAVVREIHARTVLVRSRIPGVRYTINPYGGCSHGCVYCYAVFMERFHGMGEPWGTYLNVKVNAPEVLERDLAGLNCEDRGTVLLSSVCDPYLPEEREFRLTRRILAMLLSRKFPVSILTKGGRIGLIERDMDLFKRFARIEVGLTITGLRETDRRLWEPRASPHSDRIRTLKILREAGIKTWAFVGPLLPGISDPDMIFQDLDGLVDHVLVDMLNIKKGVWVRLEPFLRKEYPHLVPLYQDIMRGDQTIWNDITKQVKKHSNGIKYRLV